MRSVADRFAIEGVLYESAHTVVLRARDVLLDRTVAIKVPARDDGASRATIDAVFAREAKALATLRHPNIITLYDYYSMADRPALVMQYVGRSLAAKLDSGEILRAAADVAAALDHCSNRGMAHRDIKPENILLDEDGRASVIDFGIAANFDDSKNWDSVVGTMPFVSPELLMAKFEDVWGPELHRESRQYDQFGLGVTLYQTLTGELPHDRRPNPRHPEWESCTAYRMMRGEEPIPANERSPIVTPAAFKVLRRMMSIDSRDRFPSCREAIAELDDAMSGRGLSGRKIFMSYSRSDAEYVSQLTRELRRRGVGVWWDADVVHGRDWEEQTEEGMIGSEVMLLMLSTNSSRSPEVKSEWHYWINALKKPIVIVLLEDCRVPYKLYPLQHIKAFDRPPDRLAVEIVDVIEQILPTPRPPVPHERTIPKAFPAAIQAYADAPLTERNRAYDEQTFGYAMPSKRIELDLPRTVIRPLRRPPP
jgi:serine/threonine protein kinase